eukprot:TRINITY_DN1020_c0_g1_i1.p2 TRINITY_DN1020_c0_g1~~TRINITY_DN1020_c0_g1_i1.p2  ORF type:complete len:92 (-),score=18.64 TRINITY_DN1020_c0_g1_i1:187-462(-)
MADENQNPTTEVVEELTEEQKVEKAKAEMRAVEEKFLAKHGHAPGRSDLKKGLIKKDRKFFDSADWAQGKGKSGESDKLPPATSAATHSPH